MSDASDVPDGPAGLMREFRRIIDSRTSPVLNTRRREAFLVRPRAILRLEAVELAPVVHDEEDNEVLDSTIPQPIPNRHPMVKVDPPTNRIAHREVRIRVWSDGRPDDFHAGKTILWGMKPLFVRPSAEDGKTGDPEFRGDWEQAAEGHRDRFEASADFGSHNFQRVSQEQATTTVDATGQTAIRINLPPVAFNAARICARIEGEGSEVALIDLEVPGIIVLDPGHGGTSNLPGSSSNNATSYSSGILEKELALDIALRTRAALYALRSGSNKNLRVHMTRDEDSNIRGDERAFVGRDNGADILLSIHFNGFDGVARGTETLVRRSSDNVNHAEDTALARRVNDAVLGALLSHDADARDRGIKEQQLAVLSDRSLGNTVDYHPLRSALLEVEFIDNPAVDSLLNIDEGHEDVRQDIADAIAAALIVDLRSNS